MSNVFDGVTDNNIKEKLLKTLDLPKGEGDYYLDYYGKKISFNGIKLLKPEYTKLPLTDIHKKEIKRCKEDFYYFVYNYCKILTKDGITFPEIRNYQKELLNVLLLENDTIILLSRQAGKSVIVGLYLLWQGIFKTDINIGIAGNTHSLAKEILNKIKLVFLHLPIWLTPNIREWNKNSIEFDNNVRILTAPTTGDAFRGFTINILFVDEVAFIRPSLWQEFEDAVFPAQSALSFKQNILTSTANGFNHFYHYVKGAKENEILDFKKDDLIELENGKLVTIEEYYNKYFKK